MVSLQDSVGAISEGDAGPDVLAMEESLEAGVGGTSEGGVMESALGEGLSQGDAMEASFEGVSDSANKELLLEGNDGRERVVTKEPTISEQ